MNLQALSLQRIFERVQCSQDRDELLALCVELQRRLDEERKVLEALAVLQAARGCRDQALLDIFVMSKDRLQAMGMVVA